MKTNLLSLLAAAILLTLPTCSVNLTTDEGGDLATTSAYVGTFSRDEGWVNGTAEGVYQIDVRVKNGKILNKQVVSTITNPAFVVESADEKYLYVASHLGGEDEPTGFLHVLDINNDYKEISKLPAEGQATCHIGIDQTGNYLVTSNYNGGVSKLFRRLADGSIFATDKFQAAANLVPGKQPHLHSANFSPDNKTIAIADLGYDRVWLFSLDAVNGKLIPKDQPFIKLADGAGPRHTEWSADGRFLYVINELNSTIDVVAHDATTDRFASIQTIPTLPEGYTGKNACADIHLHGSGKFLYGSNRGHDSIVGYKVDPKTGRLETISHASTVGEFPRNFAIAPSGRFLYVANQNTFDITVFSLNEKSGQLTYTDQRFPIGTPVCIEF